MDLRDRYPARSFLLTKDRRFLVRRADGTLDPVALRMSHKLLDTYTSLAVEKRARLQKSITRMLCVGDSVRKDAWSYDDLTTSKKLTMDFGFPVVIEVPDGGTRTGTSKDGTQWSRVLDGMSYGFMPDTIAADAEELDVVVGKDITAPMAFVLDQGDEIKLALGYATAQDARDAYEKNWPAGMLKGMYEVPMSLVRALLSASEPATLAKSIYAAKRMSGMSAGTVVVMNGDVIGEIRKSASSFITDNRINKSASAMSMEQLQSLVSAQLRKRFTPPDASPSVPAYVVDVWLADTYDDSIVYSYQNELWRMGYAINGADVALVGEPIRVRRTYEPVETQKQTDGRSVARQMLADAAAFMPHANSQAKSAMDVGTFAGGGAKLPGQAQATDDEPASSKDPSVLARKGRYDDIDFRIPQGVAEEARRGLDWRAEHGRGGTDVGVATARTLVGEQRVSPDKARHVAEYFPRHEGDSKGEGYSPGEDGFPSNGRIAWALWGGDAGRAWANKLVEQMRARDEAANKSRFSHLVDVLPVVKAAEGEREFVAFGVVLEPEPNNGAGDLHRETYSEDFVRQTAHDYTAYFMNLDDQHGEFLPLTKAVVVESYVTKQPETWGARTVKQGSWILGVRVTDPALKAQILSGAKTGLSIEGFAERVPNTQPVNAAAA